LPITEVLAAIIEEAGVPRSRMVVIPNGIDPRDYAALPSADEAKARLGLSGRLVIGFTGFVREWDQLERIVRWLATRRGNDAPHLLVVGDGPARAGAEDCARELGVADRVTFTGVVPRRQVPALAVAFDIALQTALVPYASPLCLFEYLALGKPIVAPKQPNHQEILCDGVDALLYDPSHATGIEAALDVLCDDAALRERLARRAAQVIGDRQLTWAHHARRVSAIVERLADVGCARGREKLRPVASQSPR
jgi:glycosyltransferase involved in cell wall biosynthesis